MVKQVPYFEDASGKPHKHEFEAWQADMVIWLNSTGTVNEASAKALVSHITSDRVHAKEFTVMLGSLMALIPSPPAPPQGRTDV